MSSRALSLATVMLVTVVFAAGDAGAKNLDAGKSAPQMFSGNCAACHKGARGLLRTVPPGSLPGFLRQHYTTGPDMAGMLSAYLISNGATDQRRRVEPPKSHPGDLRTEPRQVERQGRKPLPQPAQPPESAAQQNEAQVGKDRRTPANKRKPGKQSPEEAAKAGVAGQGASPSDAAVKPETAKTEPSGATPPKENEAVSEEAVQEKTPRGAASKPEPAGEDAAEDKTAKDEAPKKESAKDEAGGKQPASEQAANPKAVDSDAQKPDSVPSSHDKAGAGKDGTAGKPDVDKSEAGQSSAVGSGKPDGAPADAATSGEPKAVPLRADPVPAVTPAPKPDPAPSANDKPDLGKDGADGKPAVDKSEAGKSGAAESGKLDSIPADAPDSGEPKAVPLRADPVPAVTPSPKAGEGNASPSAEPAASSSAPPPAPDR